MTAPTRVLLTGSRPPRSLGRALDQAFEVELAPELPAEPGSWQVILAAGPQRPPGPERAQALARFIRGGGGVVTLGSALFDLTREPSLASLLGTVPADLSPVTELVVSPVAGHPVTARLDPEIRITDRVHLGLRPPPSATVLLTLSWHYSQRPVGFVQPVAEGRHLHLELGGSLESLASPWLRQLAHRAVRYAAGLAAQSPIGVGLLGYGAIGREHAASVSEVQGLELRAVCDRAQERRQSASQQFGVPAFSEFDQLLGDPQVDLVVVGVPPSAHAQAVLESLAAGKHVVCEKPFSLTRAESDQMIEAATRRGRVLTVYQSRRWDPDFVALRSAVAAGEIGEPFYMESFIGGYAHPCGYWHSHQPVSGGTIFDWGSHYFDWVLLTFPGQVARVSATAHKRVWHDVTNADQVRVDLTFEDGAQATFLQSDIAAALKPKWYLLGTRGALVGDWRLESVTSRAWTGDLIEDRLQPAESPAIVRVLRPDGEGSSHEETLALPRRTKNGFYRNLADHLLEAEPLAVRPEQARRTVALMEAAQESVAAGGEPVQVRI